MVKDWFKQLSHAIVLVSRRGPHIAAAIGIYRVKKQRTLGTASDD